MTAPILIHEAADSLAGLSRILLAPDPDRPRRFSMGPAEIELAPETYEAALWYFRDGMMNPRGGDFAELLHDCRAAVLQLAGMTATHEAAFVTGSGSNAAQAMCSVVRRDERVALLQTGTYSRRIGETLRHEGVTAKEFDATGGQAVDLEGLEQFVLREKCGLLAFIAGPTDTTTLTPFYDICRMAEEHGWDLIVDTISTFGSEPVDWLADHAARFRAVTIGLNKALRCGVLGVNACVAVRKDTAKELMANRDSFIWTGGSEDLKTILEFHRDGMHKQTMSPMALALVHQALSALVEGGGMGSLVREYRFRAAYLRRELRRLGMEIWRHERPAPLMAIGTSFKLPARFKKLKEFMDALARHPVGGRRFDIYGEPMSRERLRFFGLGHPGHESRRLEETAREVEVGRAEASGDRLAAAYFRGDSLRDFSVDERTKIIETHEEHEVGTHSDFVKALGKASKE